MDGWTGSQRVVDSGQAGSGMKGWDIFRLFRGVGKGGGMRVEGWEGGGGGEDALS